MIEESWSRKRDAAQQLAYAVRDVNNAEAENNRPLFVECVRRMSEAEGAFVDAYNKHQELAKRVDDTFEKHLQQ